MYYNKAFQADWKQWVACGTFPAQPLKRWAVNLPSHSTSQLSQNISVSYCVYTHSVVV